MIARIWKGEVPADRADAYHEFLKTTGYSDYRATPGNLGVFSLRRMKEGRAEFLLLTLWESIDAIKAFAGEEYEKARYYPEDASFLLSFPERVEHFDVLALPDDNVTT